MTFKLLKRLFSQSIQESFAYRTTSVIVIISSLIFFAIELITGFVLFDHTELIKGWSKQDYFLLISVANLINSLYQLFFIVGHENLAEIIIEGELDYTLLRPVNAFYFYAFNRVDLPSLVNVFLSSLLLIFMLSFYPLSILQVCLFILTIIFAVYFVFLLNQIVVSLSFWIERGGRFLGLPEYLTEMAAKPAGIYPKGLILILSWLVPVFLAFNYPVLIIKQDYDWKMLLYFFAFVIALHFLALFIWKKGIAKYQSSN